MLKNLSSFPPYLMMADDGTAVGGSAEPTDTVVPEPAADNVAEKSNNTDASNPFGFKPTVDGPEDTKQEEPVIPQEYEFKVAEGIELTEDMKNEFTAIAKECKLTQEQASKLIDLHSKRMLDMLGQVEAQHQQWMNETHRLGYDSKQGTADAKLCLDTFGGSDAINVLMESGVIYHPAVFKMFKEIGSLLQEDTAPQGKSTNPAVKDLGDIFFPNSK